MRKTVLVCDLCGREITGSPARLKPETEDQGTGAELRQELAEKDFHRDCADRVIRRILDMLQGGGPGKPSGRRKIDRGKVMALDRAGWAVKKIAGEMQCSDQGVRNILAESREETDAAT